MKKIKFIFLFTLFILLTSCLYKMPNDDTVSLIPMTNNPKIIQNDGQPALPTQGGF